MKKSLSKKSASLFMALLIIMSLSLTAYAENVSMKKNRASNRPFAVANMFPGDAETNDYTVNVSHKNPVSLYFTAEIHPGSEILAEVLMMKVYLPEKDILLYDGLMKDVPRELEHSLAADEKQVVYRITAYLDTSTGNDYQYKELSADFRWWYREEATEPAPDSGNTGDTSATPDTGDFMDMQLLYGVMLVSGAALAVLVTVKKKEEREVENG